MANGEKTNTVSYWRGTVDQKLTSLEDKTDDLAIKIDKLMEKVDSLVLQKNEDSGKFVEWEYIRDKFTVPIVIGTILFILFTLMPAALVVIYK
jgi:hypothetical protein